MFQVVKHVAQVIETLFTILTSTSMTCYMLHKPATIGHLDH